MKNQKSPGKLRSLADRDACSIVPDFRCELVHAAITARRTEFKNQEECPQELMRLLTRQRARPCSEDVDHDWQLLLQTQANVDALKLQLGIGLDPVTDIVQVIGTASLLFENWAFAIAALEETCCMPCGQIPGIMSIHNLGWELERTLTGMGFKLEKSFESHVTTQRELQGNLNQGDDDETDTLIEEVEEDEDPPESG